MFNVYEENWFVCEYHGNGIWKPVSSGHWCRLRACEECDQLFKERSPRLHSIAVIDRDYLIETGVLQN
jgi:hypothetical protein